MILRLVGLARYYRQLIGEAREWLQLAAGILLLGVAAGVLSEAAGWQLLQRLSQLAMEQLRELVTDVVDSSAIERIWLIFQNNLLAVALMVLLGFVMGYVPFMTLFLNGLLLGAIAWQAVVVHGELWTLLATTVPHGIFEIPAVILAAGFGLRIGWAYLHPSAQGQRLKILNHNVLDGLAILVPVALLLVIAAVIEGGILFGMLN